MNRGLRIALVALVCTPMVLSLVLFLMVKWPAMDGFTQKMPVGVKAAVASGIVNLNFSDPSSFPRAEMLDATAAKAAKVAKEDAAALQLRLRSMAASRTAGGFIPPAGEGGDVDKLEEKAQDLEKNRDYCSAEELYARASSNSATSNDYWHTEDMGRVGLACGDIAGARAGLETSLEMADRYLKNIHDDPDDVEDTKGNIIRMHETLVVVYDRQHEKKLSAESCKAAHPEWKKCGCSFKDATVSCVERR